MTGFSCDSSARSLSKKEREIQERRVQRGKSQSEAEKSGNHSWNNKGSLEIKRKSTGQVKGEEERRGIIWKYS